MPSQSILKRVKDLNICMEAAKENSIGYRVFSVNKDEFTPFLSKRLEWETLNQGERPSLSPHFGQFKGNHRKLDLIHFLLPDCVPCFQLGTGTSLPETLSSGSRFQGAPSDLRRLPSFPPPCTSYWGCTEVNLMPSSLHQPLMVPTF